MRHTWIIFAASIACVGDSTIPNPDAASNDATSGGDAGVARAFVTPVTVGDFAPGLAGADAYCTAKAKAANLGGTNVWVAILSDGSVAAKDRLVIHGAVVNMKGGLVASSAADLWDGSIANPIRYDELGNAVSGSVFTSTTPDGTKAAG